MNVSSSELKNYGNIQDLFILVHIQRDNVSVTIDNIKETTVIG